MYTQRIWREEIFGPVVAICRFSTEQEALDLANDTTYGLGAAVFTTNLERAHRVAAESRPGWSGLIAAKIVTRAFHSAASSRAASAGSLAKLD